MKYKQILASLTENQKNYYFNCKHLFDNFDIDDTRFEMHQCLFN